MFYTCKSLRQIRKRNRFFCALRNDKDLSILLRTPQHQLQLLAQNPPYKVFDIRKRNGKFRHIEAPETKLKNVQRLLNNFLQSVYYFQKSYSAYGFVMNAKGESMPRNIITHAERHLGQKYLLNIDMKDFFHQIKASNIYYLFTQHPFHFSDTLAELLTNLCTRIGRLPMGAPSSPVLSNFASLPLDHDLQVLAHRQNWIYTRFADDLSFSSASDITEKQYQQIREVIQAHALVINEEKVKKFGAKEIKIVTGLAIDEEKVSVPTTFITQLEKDIKCLQTVVSAMQKCGHTHSNWVHKMQQQVSGKLNFLGYVSGQGDEHYQELAEKLHIAKNPPDDFDTLG